MKTEFCFCLEELSLTVGLIRVIGFDHREAVLAKIPAPEEDLNENIALHVNLEKSSSFAVYEYFSSKLSESFLDDVSMTASITVIVYMHVFFFYVVFLFSIFVILQIGERYILAGS